MKKKKKAIAPHIDFSVTQNHIRLNEIITSDQSMIPFHLWYCIARVINNHRLGILKQSKQLIVFKNKSSKQQKPNQRIIPLASSKSTPHSVAMPRIRSEADESAASIKSCPASTKSRTAFWSNDPPKPSKNKKFRKKKIIIDPMKDARDLRIGNYLLRWMDGEKRMRPS